MFRLGVKNLRRLRNFPAVEIKPLTLLVGRNSSGKSTFLRTLPLLRQSVTTRTSSPILWYGDWVDFGDFDGAVFGNNSSHNMTFTFGVDRVNTNREIHVSDEEILEEGEQEYDNVTLEVEICKDGKGTRISELKLYEPANNVKFELSINAESEVKSFKIDGAEMMGYLGAHRIIIQKGAIFPTLAMLRRSPAEGITMSYLMSPARQILSSPLRDLLGPRLDPRIKGPSFERLINQLAKLTVITKESIRSSSEIPGNKSSWKKLIKDITDKDRDGMYERLRSILLLSRLSIILRQTSNQLRTMVSSTLYIGPARTKSDRYYRYQDLNVSEIDPDGKNFPMFLNSLPGYQLRSFSDWVKGLFGYGVKVTGESGHISIELIYPSGTVNVVDTGYGVSQILPVLGQVWWATNRDKFRPRSVRPEERSQIIAIEQPELHLHPAHQSLLADAFVNSLKGRLRKGNEIYFIVETHSEALINRLGALIAESAISESDVQIIIFDMAEDDDEAITEPRTAKFNPNGELVDWPYGFFAPISK